MSVLLLMIRLQIGKRIEEFEHLMIVHGYGRQIRSSQSTSHLRHWPASCSRVSTPAIYATYLSHQDSSAPSLLFRRRTDVIARLQVRCGWPRREHVKLPELSPRIHSCETTAHIANIGSVPCRSTLSLRRGRFAPSIYG